jgi:chromate transporter
LGFTMPSAVAMIAFGYGVGELGNISHVPWLQGLKIVAGGCRRAAGRSPRSSP